MKNKILSQMLTMLTASIAFVSALAWNEAVLSVFNKFYYFKENGILARFIYAIVITTIAVIMSSFLFKLLDESKNLEKPQK